MSVGEKAGSEQEETKQMLEVAKVMVTSREPIKKVSSETRGERGVGGSDEKVDRMMSEQEGCQAQSVYVDEKL